MNHFSEFQHQQVRDLAWVCLSPPLLSELPGTDDVTLLNSPQVDKPALTRWLRAVDDQPLSLEKHLSQLRSPRLGIYYEALCAYFWKHYPNHQLHGQNLQVTHKQQTFGEYDLIAEAPSGLYHIEVAVKFYLGIPDHNSKADSTSQWQQWTGPNCNDRLDKKLSRLIDHQLQLSASPPGREALIQQGIAPQQINKALKLQGYLFYPAHTKLAAPAHTHTQHLRGKWYYAHDFIERLNQQQDSRWFELHKQHWLSPAKIDSDKTNKLLTTKALASYLKDYFNPQSSASTINNKTNNPKPDNRTIKHRPLLLTEMIHHNKQWQEQSRCFVVADDWPWDY